MSSAVVVEQAPSTAAPAPAARRLWVHSLALALVLLGLAWGIGTDVVYSADEGAVLLQADLLDRSGDWTEANPFPDVDPTGEFFGVHLAKQYDDGTFGYFVRRPAYPYVLSLVSSAGLFGAIVLSILGTVAAASASGRIVRHWKPEMDVAAVWVSGLASPLVFNSFWAIAHTIAAGLLGWAVVLVLGSPNRRATGSQMVAGGALVAVAVLFRSEAILYGIALTLGLFAVDALVDRKMPVRAVVVGAGTVAGIVVNKALVTMAFGAQLIGVVDGTVSGGSSSWLTDRINAFTVSVLRVSPDGWEIADGLLVLAIGLGVLSVFAAKKDPGSDDFAKLAFGAAGLAVARTVIDPTTVVRGLVMAFPLLVIGVAAMSAKYLSTRPAMVVAITSTLFAAAVVLTQHRSGGSAEFGGRYFAVMLPVVTPLLLVAVAGVGAASSPSARRAWRVAIGVVGACTIVMALVGLERAKDRGELVVDAQRVAIEQVVASTGEPAVVVSTLNPASRWAFELADQSRWLLLDDDELREVADRLARTNVERFVVVGSAAKSDPQPKLGRFSLSGTVQPLDDFPLTVSIYTE